MARPEKFGVDDILDAAARAVLARGTRVTVAEIAREAGAPVGSVYYRFASREELLVSLWLRCVRGFQERFIAACGTGPATKAVVAAARCVPVYCREHPAEAVSMTLYRQPDLLRTAPPSLQGEVVAVNDQVRSALRDLAARRYSLADEWRASLVVAATVQCPQGLVRPHLGGAVPEWVDDAVAACAQAIAALGD